jgi:nucleoside permease NupC
MPLQIRPMAVSTAVLCFFVLGIVGSLGGLSPYTCCRRALLGAAISYLVTALAMRAINAILTRAMIADQVRKENLGDNQD